MVDNNVKKVGLAQEFNSGLIDGQTQQAGNTKPFQGDVSIDAEALPYTVGKRKWQT